MGPRYGEFEYPSDFGFTGSSSAGPRPVRAHQRSVPAPRGKGVPAFNREPLVGHARGGKVEEHCYARGGQTKSQQKVAAAGRKLKENPPAVLAKTREKKGPEAAEKQRVAIMLSKARAAGARIPKPKG